MTDTRICIDHYPLKPEDLEIHRIYAAQLTYPPAPILEQIFTVFPLRHAA